MKPRTGPEVADAQPAVQVDVVEGLRPIGRLPLVQDSSAAARSAFRRCAKKVEKIQRIVVCRSKSRSPNPHGTGAACRRATPDTARNPTEPIGRRLSAAVAPAGGRRGDLDRRRFAQVAVEPAAEADTDLVPTAVAVRSLRMCSKADAETPGNSAACSATCSSRTKACAASSTNGDTGNVRDALGVAGLDQPVAGPLPP